MTECFLGNNIGQLAMARVKINIISVSSFEPSIESSSHFIQEF